MNDDIKKLEKRILQISYKYHLAHIGSALTALPIIKKIYEIKTPEEKFINSSAHNSLALYVVLEYNKFGDAEELFKKHGVHCCYDPEHDIWASAGSLGHGLPIALGIALSDRSKRVFCLVSDGECMEGSIWETLRIAEETKVNNLHIFFNVNGWGGYKAINTHSLYAKLDHYKVKKTIVFTQIPHMPGLEAHYKILNEKEYKETIKTMEKDGGI